MVRWSLTGCSQRQALEWLTRLHVRCKKAKNDDRTLEVWLETFMDGLLGDEVSGTPPAPADIARQVLLVKRWGWLPDAQDLFDEIDRLANPRRVALCRLQQYAKNPPRLISEVRRSPQPTPREKARVNTAVQNYLYGPPLTEIAKNLNPHQAARLEESRKEWTEEAP